MIQVASKLSQGGSIVLIAHEHYRAHPMSTIENTVSYIKQLLNHFSLLFPSISLKGGRPWRALRAYRPAIVASLLSNARPRADGSRLLRGPSGSLPKWALPPWNPHTRRREARGAGQARRCRLTPHPEPRLGHSTGVKGPCPRPTGCGPHQPLDPGSVPSGGRVKARAATPKGLGLDAAGTTPP